MPVSVPSRSSVETSPGESAGAAIAGTIPPRAPTVLRWPPRSRIEIRRGSLLEARERHVVHGCNASGGFGKGVAEQIKAAYPAACEAYKAEHRAGRLRLGLAQFVDCGRHVVVNGVTQRAYGHDAARGHVYVDYEAVRAVFRSIDDRARREGFSAVGLPFIGTGYAGGSWARISAVILEEARWFEPVVYSLDGRVPQG
ncbi:macro domain-containing protein [Methylobacterium radiotolerans]|uniref:macro domain-containing protein n=1 Tax=Methylobacterium radiotolerans TaxID=31998 RepID=UPI0038D24A40